MLIATFRSGTPYQYSRGLTYFEGVFVIEGAGPTTAEHVSHLDRESQLQWVDEATRVWFQQAFPSRPPHRASSTRTRHSSPQRILIALLILCIFIAAVAYLELLTAVSSSPEAPEFAKDFAAMMHESGAPASAGLKHDLLQTVPMLTDRDTIHAIILLVVLIVLWRMYRRASRRGPPRLY